MPVCVAQKNMQYKSFNVSKFCLKFLIDQVAQIYWHYKEEHHKIYEMAKFKSHFVQSSENVVLRSWHI